MRENPIVTGWYWIKRRADLAWVCAYWDGLEWEYDCKSIEPAIINEERIKTPDEK